MRSILFVAAAIAASPVALAQQPFTFAIDQSLSNFTWSGTTTVGPIVGNPSNQFQLSGTTVELVAPLGAQAVGSAQFSGGDAAVVPDIHGKIPNPIPFLPPLATIDVVNLHLSPSSPTFGVATGGAFVTDVTMTALSGVMTVNQLGGGTTVTDLAGQASSPSPATGSLVQSGTTLFLTVPVDVTFAFSDSSSGISGSLTVVGTIHASWTPSPATIYCTAKTNSLGCVPQIAFGGTASYTNAAACSISASQVINNKSGLFFYGGNPNGSPFQGGTLCVQPPIKRTNVQSSGGNPPPNDCSGAYALDFNAYIASGADASLVPGKAVHGQYWSRDPQDAFTTSLSNGVRFDVAP